LLFSEKVLAVESGEKIGMMQKKKRGNFVIRCLCLAFTLTLHIVIFVWLSLPPAPLYAPTSVPEEIEPMRPMLVTIRHREVATTRATPVTSEPEKNSTQVREPKKAEPTSHPAHVANVNQAVAAPPPETALPPQYTQDVFQSSPAVPYGNSKFEQALTQSQSAGMTRIPGDDDFRKVAGINVQEQASVVKTIKHVGHWLKCKDAVFKSRMTDQELIKRGLTQQQMLQKYVEEGCP
jgi:hypothetical protein